ncbi:N-acetylmuramoyl-L-alanine amidase [Streptomyces alkaliterrae]|uniref:N-acetylmuramoyl-L-alanine amidase n=1 Tax=Streptomyces alkaliterrae TaxID=2213162 RepID=A0A5P0YQR4_9ACTN|nr:N-acetylmuramoyl-L-alanine amidase [Streptomyces alkaliterrae]MBB1255165.1 N-acetylmuramoyl-L-alanine amidase [Streptomyces alkaliterrae]MBB1257897.1 N-acetylmuramoyl-L-alanine amidase [Streptomyces alkaliterrae]MQS02653.1 N-acetylmuramoyl-L-alanine amidase [Streptomyces alkaliterrae]
MSGGRRLFTVLAVVLPLCLAAGLVWLVARRADAGRETDTARPPAAPSTTDPGSGTPEPAEPSGPPETSPGPSKSGPADHGSRPETSTALTGKVVVIDPGHNPGNRNHPAELNRRVDIGTGRKECDTTGTASDAGYPEARFTLEVSRRVRTLLEERGAVVKLTQDDDRPFGPCIDERARIGNREKADAVVSVHADGSAPGNRGFHVILPAAVKAGAADTTGIVEESRRLGGHLADRYRSATGMRPAGYLGPETAATGLTTRDDLGGLNLSRVPKVFLECGNMRDAEDVALLTDPAWQRKAARGIADGVTSFLVGKR